MRDSHERPAADDQRPTTDGEQPAADDQRPTTDGERPTADGERPATDGKSPTTQRGGPTDDERVPDVPESVVDEAERLTRLARQAVDENERAAARDRRDELLADYDYESRIRTDEDRDTLVCYPAEWVEDGVVHPDRVDDVDRGVERPLEGPGAAAEWETIAEHNDELAAAVSEADADHGANARALADFASNHYAKPIEDLTADELREFRDEYYPRNVWPTDQQRALLAESLRVVFEKTDRPCPLYS